MNNTQHYDFITDFFQVVVNSINSMLVKELDTDICSKIQFKTTSSSNIRDTESLKENNVIYEVDYATGNRQGSVIALIPEELIADISDILTGGNGDGAYKGSLSEIETNSISGILEKIFKHIESDFKKENEHDLAFSSNPKFLLKEMPDYEISSESYKFDLLIANTLDLTENKQYKINILLNENTINELMGDLGLSETDAPKKHNSNSSLDVKNLSDVKINITAELGRTRVPIKYALELVKGSLVELDTINNSDIKVYANGVEFAYAQVVAVEENFGLKITKIISPEERLENI